MSIMSSVTISRSSNSLPPLIKKPEYNLHKVKTPTQQRLEEKANISNQKVERMKQTANDKVFQMLQRTFRNTQYDVRYQVENGSNKQFTLTQKTTGETLYEFPVDVAKKVAEKAKQTTVGLIIDYSA